MSMARRFRAWASRRSGFEPISHLRRLSTKRIWPFQSQLPKLHLGAKDFFCLRPIASIGNTLNCGLVLRQER